MSRAGSRGAGWAALAGYVAVIVGANWAIETFGLVPVGFGLAAPAGVYCAGLAFTLRDIVQERLGKRWSIGAIVIGAALSWTISPQFALASGVAFLVSELADFAIYTPLRERGMIRAVVASNVVGMVADGLLFLTIAFGNIDFLTGLTLGKLYTIVPAVALLWLWKRRQQRAVVVAVA